MPERLLKRHATYYFRAKYPVDLRHRFKAGGRWKSLGTKELTDAKLKVRVESVRFDAEMVEHRKRLSEPFTTALAETPSTLGKIAKDIRSI